MYTSSNAVLPATGAGLALAPISLIGALCLAIGLFAVLASAGALNRVVPAGIRRGISVRRDALFRRGRR